MKKSMIEWIIDSTSDRMTEQRKSNQNKAFKFERLHHRIDDKIMFCIYCNRIWQRNRKMMTREWEYYPKNHIPTIGKKRKKCPNCKEKNKNG